MAVVVTATHDVDRAAPAGAVRPAFLPPQQRFHCRLDDQPGFLVPPRLVAAVPDAMTSRLFVNPSCWFSRWGAPPPAVRASSALLENFDWGEEAVCVTDPILNTLLPFSLGPEYRALTAAFVPGTPLPVALPPKSLETLLAARVLVAPNEEARRHTEWSHTLPRAQQEFRERHYTTMTGLLHPFHLGSLRRYYRYLIRTGTIQLGDGQSPRRFAAHNESATRFFHQQLGGIVSAIVGEPVKPSYVYFASYQSGAELPRHTDRPQCEFSISMLVDFTPEPDLEAPWPIHLDTADGRVSIYQAIGDSLLYRGRALPHLRDPLSDGCTSTSVFFHYVPEGFRGSLQ
jgi:hypothetical protein